MTPTPITRKFILHWGEMGTRWGINRSVAQIHALLYVARAPLNADQIGEALGIARSNISTSLRELQGWRIVRTVHLQGDRRDHFESVGDVWELFRTVIEERKRREIDPTVALLAECIAEADKAGPEEAHVATRLRTLHEFLTTMTAWYDDLRRLPMAGLVEALRFGKKLRGMLGFGRAAKDKP